jgi:hypothetical protein
MAAKGAVPRKVEKIEAHRRRQARRGRPGSVEEDGGGGAYRSRLQRPPPFKGDVVVLVGERRELCSVDEVDKGKT